ncbi:MAG: alpha-L-fucosidase [Bacteroidales bacterium]|nr:alpha-L-fucosidase [Bacteroidales bacterium]
MFLCLDPCTWQGREYDDHTTPLDRINPDRLDVNQWIDAAESFDAKMILFVAKHTGGFCWWQTETSGYSIKNTPYKNGKGDVLDELAKACFDRGMKLGIYIYPGDDTWGAYNGGGGKTKDPDKQEGYNRVLRKQWEEVLSRYGNQLTEIWFDGSVIVPLEDVIKKHAPSAIVFQGPFADIRWVGNERGFCPYPNWYTVKAKDGVTGIATAEHNDPEGDMWLPVEVDVTLRNHYWFWSSTNEQYLRSLDDLMTIYYQSVGRGATLLLNATPDTTGLIPAADMALYRTYGGEIRKRFETSVAETSGNGNTLELRLDHPAIIDHVIIQEDIVFGQRVRQYAIEGFTENKWTQLSNGLSIGQKRIERFSPVEVTSVRLRVDESAFPPVIKRFAAFYAGPDNDGKPSGLETKTEKDIGTCRISSGGHFEFDLSPYIPLAEQYTLRFKSREEVVRPAHVSLWLQGVETPDFAAVHTDGSIHVNITAYPGMKKGSIVIKGRFDKKPAKACRLYIQ